MEAPTAVISGAKEALNLKTLVMVMVITLIVIFLLSKIVKKTITIKDNNGNVTGTGEMNDKFVWFKK